MKRRNLSGCDFELAWRLRPNNLDFEYKAATRAVLVDGKTVATMCDVPDWGSAEPFKDGYVSKQRLADNVRETYEQIFVHVA